MLTTGLDHYREGCSLLAQAGEVAESVVFAVEHPDGDPRSERIAQLTQLAQAHFAAAQVAVAAIEALPLSQEHRQEWLRVIDPTHPQLRADHPGLQ